MDRCSTVRFCALTIQPSRSDLLILGIALVIVVSTPFLLAGWASMLVNCGTLFMLMKQLVWDANANADRCATLRERAAFYLLWPGMDAKAFIANDRPPATRPAASEWIAAVLKILVAIAGLELLSRFALGGNTLAVGIAGMLVGVLLIHSGLFHLLALSWQLAGRPVRPIMNAPLAAMSLADFWGRRWNLAFRDAAALLVFRPAARQWGTAVATFATFLASGVLHDAVISLPARGGYGLPTVYFLLQYAGLMMERRVFPNGSRGWKRIAARATTAIVVLLPLPLLFHQSIARNVVVPFLNVLTSL